MLMPVLQIRCDFQYLVVIFLLFYDDLLVLFFTISFLWTPVRDMGGKKNDGWKKKKNVMYFREILQKMF